MNCIKDFINGFLPRFEDIYIDDDGRISSEPTDWVANGFVAFGWVWFYLKVREAD